MCTYLFEEPFPNLVIKIQNGIFSIQLYNKIDDFSFQ